MYRLPLFPLKTVLFPNMPITLHIFEPRYRLMIAQCLQTDQPFGVVLIREGREALGPLAEPHPVGCSAEITDVEHLEDGRMNIVAVGRERFRILSLSRELPYLVGTVEPLAPGDAQAPDVIQASRQLRPWVERYLAVLARASESVTFDPTALPEDPLTLGYLAASLVQIPVDEKQALLATGEAVSLLAEMRAIYRREVALLDVILERDRALAQAHRFFSTN